jgi:EAL and modified HD-GYP domain-containing signal transduction protein
MSEAIYLGRQPILDAELHLAGYELLFRSSTANSAQFADGTLATAEVVAHAFTELGIGDALGARRAFINVDSLFLLDDAIELLPPTQVVLEVLESVTATPQIVARCEALRAAGFSFALDDLTSIEDPRLPLLPLTEIVKLDLPQLGEAAIRELVQALRARSSARLLAEKVDNAEQLEFCKSLSFDYYQGYFFAKPSVIQGRRLDNSRLSLLKILAQLLEDADTAILEKGFKESPGLTVNLLRLVNSVATGLQVRITSLRHAITILGRRQLQRWLQLLLYTDPSGKDSLAENPLLQLAATRGRLMELLAAEIAPRDERLADFSFVCGVMSLTPALFQRPLEEVLAQVSLAAPICDALTERKGRLGELLALVESTETEDPEDVAARLRLFPMLRTEVFTVALAAALAWANAIGKPSNED